MIDWSLRALTRRLSTEAIVLHHTAGRSAVMVEHIDRFHREERGWAGGIGYHYLIHFGADIRWRVSHGRPDNTVGAHAAMTVPDPRAPNGERTVGWNRRSIGVAIAGTWDEREPPDEAVDLALGLVVDLRSHYGQLRILSHREAMAELVEPWMSPELAAQVRGHTSCPGLGGWVDWIRDRLPADGPA